MDCRKWLSDRAQSEANVIFNFKEWTDFKKLGNIWYSLFFMISMWKRAKVMHYETSHEHKNIWFVFSFRRSTGLVQLEQFLLPQLSTVPLFMTSLIVIFFLHQLLATFG